MTYIAKAMSKQTRLDAAAERVAHDPRQGEEADSKRGESDIEFVQGGAARPEEPRILAPGATAKTLAGMNSRARAESPSLPPEMLGTLESPPPEMEFVDEKASRTWWKEPVVIGGGALGFAALMIGFLFAPSGGPVGPDSASGSGAASAQQAVAAAGASTPDETGATTASEAGANDGVVSSSGRKPVVVRVQIDSGDGSSVEFESAESRAPAPSRSAPAMPEIYEPLQPLELPPPPVAEYTQDYTVDDPTPSSSGSRYSAPPPSGDSITDYRLEGIFWSEENPGVIINDEILDEGERIDQLRVRKIYKDYVVVELRGRTYDLR